MAERTIVRCEQCGSIAIGRKTEDRFILPNRAGGCQCGSASFVDLSAE